ncbi:MAG: hypothetical protein HZB76_05950 [Chlamydiae bacterium]|nr:hypothetical protein [Chlamydiota bacterium]
MREIKDSFAYLSPIGLEHKLESEIEVLEKFDRLYLSKTEPKDVFWAQNIWLEPKIVKISSINEAARFLRSLQKNWALFPYKSVRRSMLISAELPKIFKQPIIFPTILPPIDLGSFTLLDDETLLFSQKCSSKFPNGEVVFQGQKIGPPSRAYLKLWEVFTILQTMPKKNDRCLEVGASPGSWSYVLANLGVNLTSVDKAPLELDLKKYPNITFLKKDFFSITPKEMGRQDWIFSDVIVYPEKLFEWLELWKNDCDNFICTLKFQKDEHDFMIKNFAKIENSFIYHLFHNKHELTWVKLKNVQS